MVLKQNLLTQLKKKIPITETNIEKNLYTNGSPNPELLIRTGNTTRLSNFLLWQTAYSEIFFVKKHFSGRRIMSILRFPHSFGVCGC